MELQKVKEETKELLHMAIDSLADTVSHEELLGFYMSVMNEIRLRGFAEAVNKDIREQIILRHEHFKRD